jgi:intracellular septation protein A
LKGGIENEIQLKKIVWVNKINYEAFFLIKSILNDEIEEKNQLKKYYQRQLGLTYKTWIKRRR